MTDKSQTDTLAQCAGVQPSAEQIEAIAKDYAQRWYGDDFALMDDGDKADLRIEAQHWLKCWFALAAQPPAAPVETKKHSPDECGRECQYYDYFEMLWNWFADESRNGAEDMRANIPDGLSADDFKHMLDEHEASILADVALKQPGPHSPSSAETGGQND